MTKVLPFVAQPNNFSCQSACIARLLGTTNVMSIRTALEAIGEPGDPAVMGQYLKPRVKEYKYLGDACLNDLKKALDAGYQAIVHTWLTHSGHVIGIRNWEPSGKTYRFIVADPWSEFDFKSWSYPDPDRSGQDVRYSSYGMYAAAIVGVSADDAFTVYRRGELDSNRGGGWIHLVKN